MVDITNVKMYDITQRDEILWLALMLEDGITRLEADVNAHCFELAARIGELEDAGWNFEKTWEKIHRTNRRRDTKVKIYKLDPEQRNDAAQYLVDRYGTYENRT